MGKNIFMNYLLQRGYIAFKVCKHKEVVNFYNKYLYYKNYYFLAGKKNKDDKTWFDGRENKHVYCVLPAKCEKLRFSTCLGTQLPYNETSLYLTDYNSQEQAMDRLQQYRALRYVPKCWAVIQPFLCAVLLPKCETIRKQEYIYLPSYEMCRITAEPCRILYNTSLFPDFLKCNETLYPPKCNNEVREMKFNSTGQCIKPLVSADSVANYYRDIDGCGVQCKDPLYTDDEHRQTQEFIAWGASICLLFNIFVIATFLIDWENANKYPALIVFYIHGCFAMCCLGWLAQFMPGGREDIVCKKDGTLRHSEPSAGENLSCIVVFVLVYYFIIAAMVWFVIFTYAWHVSFKVIGKTHGRIDKKGSYFHLVAWSLPLVLTITIMALSEVDGSGIVGICFVGYLNQPLRFGLVLGPILGVLLVGGYFLSGCMLKLIKLKITSKDFISPRASNKMRDAIVRMVLCYLFTLVVFLATIVCHIHEFRNSTDWATSLRNFIICKISSNFEENYEICKMGQRPSVAVLQLHLLCLFASGIIMSCWVWTQSTIDIWRRYIKRKLGIITEQPMKLQKHKLIAQAFAKRKEFQEQGRLSISFHNSHTDPVGLNFNIDSTAASHDFSSTWANNLPRFVNRRCALTGAVTSSSHGGVRRNSVADSEISFSVRHVSVESRRNSIDSQVSVKIAEMKTKVARGRSKGGTTKARNRRKFHRRESSTSVESHGRIFNAKSKSFKRRSGNAGLDPMQINAFLGNERLLLPFLQNHHPPSSDDEELGDETNSTSVKVKNFDMILKHSEMNNESDVDEDESEFDRLMAATKRNNVLDPSNTTDDEKMSLSRHTKIPELDNYSSIKHILEAAMMMKSDETASSRNSNKTKNSGKSTRSRKSTKRNRRNSTKVTSVKNFDIIPLESTKKVETFYNEDYGDSSISSLNSMNDFTNVDLLQVLGGTLQSSSFSGLSKATNSRNSKRSCDVGIQTNAHEIEESHNGKILPDSDEDDEETGLKMEDSRLLPKTCQQRAVLKKPQREDLMMSESDKLKMLLLPASKKCQNL